MLRSLKSRLTFLYVGIFAGFLAALGLYIHASTAKRGWHDFDRDLQRDAAVFASLVLEELAEIDTGEHTWDDWTHELVIIPGLLKTSATLYGKDGKVLFQLGVPRMEPAGPASPADPGPPIFRTATIETGGVPGDYRVLRMGVADGRHPPMTLDMARSTRHLTRFLHKQQIALLIVLPILIALASLAGYLFVRRALRPVDEMAALAREISAGDLARRIPLPGSQGELRTLASTLNGMLARLDQAFSRMKTFTADTAHELRTPIATVRTALESSVGKSPAEMEEAIGESLEELERLGFVVQKLLLLARADAGQLLTATEQVDLSDQASQVVEMMRVPAAAKFMTIRGTGRPTIVSGDAGLLRRAIHNLVENAVKYGQKDGTIEVNVGANGLEVIDDGPGIQAEHLPHVFERFFRADGARSDRIPGHGLGLAIVKSIVEAHRGTVEAQSRPGATVFRIRFPQIPPQGPPPSEVGVGEFSGPSARRS